MDDKSLQICKSVTRMKQKDEGYFDGRFVGRSIPSKKKYNRKRKHKNESDKDV